MTLLQPDQRVDAWDDFVPSYERVFEPLTDSFAAEVFDRLMPLDGLRLLDVACGPGGAALLAARRGADVVAVDASAAMIERVRLRAAGHGRFEARVMDAARLDCADAAMDVVYSGFGVILLPDPSVGLREILRILRPGGRVAIVTWRSPEQYELASLLRAAGESVFAKRPAGPNIIPAQLRYTDPTTLAHLLSTAGFFDPRVYALEGYLRAPSVSYLVESLGFAPGMEAMLAAFGKDRDEILARFATSLQRRFDSGPIALRAIAHVAIARKSE